MFAEAVHLTNISLVECSKLQKVPLFFRMLIISSFFKLTVFELCLNLLFHAFLQCFCFASYGTTNPRSQTGSMRVRGQMFIVWFFYYFILLHIWLHHSLPNFHPSLLKDAEPSSSAGEHIAFHHLFLNSRHLCPPVSSNPPLLLPHLVLSVKLPIPVSHVLMQSSPCDPRLWSCSGRCSIHDVGTCRGRPVCLLSLLHCSHLFDACVLYVAPPWLIVVWQNAPIII